MKIKKKNRRHWTDELLKYLKEEKKKVNYVFRIKGKMFVFWTRRQSRSIAAVCVEKTNERQITHLLTF